MYHDVMEWNNNLEKKKDRTMLINAGYIFVTAISNFKGNYKEFTTIKIKVGVSIYRDQVRKLLKCCLGHGLLCIVLSPGPEFA